MNPSRVGFLAFLAWTLVPASLPAKPKGLFYYVPSEDGWQSLSTQARKIPTLAPQVFIVDGAGAIHGAVEERVRSLASRYGIELVPLLAEKTAEATHNVLVDEALRHRVISDSLRLCLESGCTGLQLDLEGVLLEDGQKFTEFVREAARVFHARNLKLSVALPSPLFAATLPLPAYRTLFGGFPVSPVPYDFEQLVPHVDFISLMTYDQYGQSTGPGPIAGYAWVEQSIRFLLQFVPREKLSLGLGFYGRRWCNQRVTESGYLGTSRLASQTGAVLRWHPWHRSPWFEFNEAGCHNFVWYENRQSLQEKLKLVRKYRLAGFSAWRLGQEDPDFWKELPERRIRRPRLAARNP